VELQFSVLANNYPALIEGGLVTLLITAIALAIGLALGAVLCAGRLLRGSMVDRLAVTYIGFFRTTPEMVLIFWSYFCIPLIFHIRVSGLLVGSIVLGLVGAAYFAEIFRAGIEGVPRGQTEAARALGLRGFPQWRFVVLPQALRLMIPPLVNYFTELIKNTTLLAGIGVAELSLQAYLIGGQTYRYVELLSAIAFAYFVVIFPISLWSRRLETKLRAAS
jgi:His/Glu/Gln/Arg/opine family amino acid ABC transporter permease subunit